MPRFVSNLIPFIVWPAYHIAMKWTWSWLTQVNPALDWAIATLLPHGDFAFYAFIYAHDVVINLILVFPIALLIYVYGNAPSWGSIFGATLFVCTWQYWPVLSNLPESVTFFSSHGTVVGLLTQIGMFPVGYLLASRVISLVRPNHQCAS